MPPERAILAAEEHGHTPSVRIPSSHLPPILTLLLIAASPGACRPAPVAPPFRTSQVESTFPSPPRIARETAGQLTQVATIEDGAGYGPVLALAVTPGTGDVLVVTRGDGTLRRYDGATWTLVSAFPLGIAEAGPAAFDKAGDALIAARVIEENLALESWQARIGDIAIWNATTGDLVHCVDTRCHRGDAYPAGDLGAALDSDGSHWLVFGEGSYSVGTPNSSVAVILNSPESDINTWTRLGQAAIDSEGHRVAAASVDGEVQIRGGPPYLGVELPHRGQGNVSALSFSPDGAFLARIWNGELAVWRMGLLRGRLVLDADAAMANSLSWSSDGRLLYVAGGNEIAVWDTGNWSEVTTVAAPSLEVVAPSPDDTLLLWGDSEGIVHILRPH